MDSDPDPSRVLDLGAQSGNETQYVFSEADVREREADALKL